MNLSRAGSMSIACGCLVLCTGAQRGPRLEEGAKSGLTPCELSQVQQALKAIKAAGYTRAADDINVMLLSGRVIADQSLTGTYRGATSFPILGDQVIRLNKDELFCRDVFWSRRNEKLYDRFAAERKVLLASTLIHEWWHSKCGYFWTVTHPYKREQMAWNFEARFLTALRGTKEERANTDLVDSSIDMIHLELDS